MVLRNYPVAEVMHKNVTTVRPTETLNDAARQIATAQYGCLLAVDDDGRPRGILTGGDLFRLFASEQLSDLRHIFSSSDALLEHLRNARAASLDRVSDCMTAPLVMVEETSTLEDVAELFEQHDFNQLPVTRDGRLVGLILRVDLLGPLLQAHEELRRRRQSP